VEDRHFKVGHPVFRPRRIALSGGTKLDPDNARFCEALGRELAAESGLTIITGGFKHLKGDKNRPSADWSYVKGALGYLRKQVIDPKSRVETLLAEDDGDGIVRFEEGNVVRLRNRTAQARRFTMVNTADAVVTAQGENGTAGVIDLALAIERPVLPLPFTGGKSESRWGKYKELIREWFGLDDSDVAYLEGVRLGGMTAKELEALAVRVKRHLLARLMRKCFIIMPFDKSYSHLYENVLKPSALGSGFTLVRADQLNIVGNAVAILRDALNASDCALAVITDFRPNVMYELGFAHAQGKPVIILCRHGEDGRLPALPFDIQTEQVFAYGDDDDELRRAVAAAFKEI
jgi:hypothetical protein